MHKIKKKTSDCAGEKLKRWDVVFLGHFPGTPCDFKEPVVLETHLVVPWLSLFLLGPLGLLQQSDLGAVLGQLCSLWRGEAKKKKVSKKPKNLHTSMTSIIRTRCHFMNGWTHKKKKNQTTTTGIHYFIWVALTFIIHLSPISFKYFTAFVKTLVKPFQALKQCV